MREASPAFITTVLVSAALVLHPSARSVVLTVLTAPLAVVQGAGRLVIQLPRLPALSVENADLRRRLMAQQADQARWREEARRQHAAEVLLEQLPGHQGVMATVMGRSLVPTQHTVLLNRGATHGMSLDSVIDIFGNRTESAPLIPMQSMWERGSVSSESTP